MPQRSRRTGFLLKTIQARIRKVFHETANPPRLWLFVTWSNLVNGEDQANGSDPGCLLGQGSRNGPLSALRVPLPFDAAAPHLSTERNGARFETGPNTILMSDVALQNG